MATRIEKFLIDDIKVVGKRRPLNKKKLPLIVDSMIKIGLRTPITVRRGTHGVVLVAGRHRLEAAKSLGWQEIDCIVMKESKIQMKLWAVAENLHRAGLTALERSEGVDKWARLAAELEKDQKVAYPGGRQPKNKGFSKAAKNLGMTREAVRRSAIIAGISSEAKAAAKANGVDRKQDALLKVAEESTPKAQTKKVHDLARRIVKRGKLSPEEIDQLKALKRAFKGALKFQRTWDKASTLVRRKFVKRFLSSE